MGADELGGGVAAPRVEGQKAVGDEAGDAQHGLRLGGGQAGAAQGGFVEAGRAGGVGIAGEAAAVAQTVLRVARLVADGLLPLDAWRRDAPAELIRARLSAIRGIGPWTIDYTLLRGFASVDGSLHGDVAVRRGLQRLLEREEKIGADEAKHWLADFAPWRALAAAHLWAAESPTARPPGTA